MLYYHLQTPTQVNKETRHTDFSSVLTIYQVLDQNNVRKHIDLWLMKDEHKLKVIYQWICPAPLLTACELIVFFKKTLCRLPYKHQKQQEKWLAPLLIHPITGTVVWMPWITVFQMNQTSWEQLLDTSFIISYAMLCKSIYVCVILCKVSSVRSHSQDMVINKFTLLLLYKAWLLLVVPFSPHLKLLHTKNEVKSDYNINISLEMIIKKPRFDLDDQTASYFASSSTLVSHHSGRSV